MASRRYAAKRRSTLKRTNRKKRAYPTRRTTRKRTRMPSRKALLNVTSRKKRNTMLIYTNTSQVNGGPVTIGPGPYTINGANGTQFSIFTPTAMDLITNSAVNPFADEALRTSVTCYIRGFSEKIRIQTSSGRPWFWRRICFRAKAPGFTLFSPLDSPTQTNSGNTSYIETNPNGMERLYFNLTINASNQTLATYQDLLFKGQVGRDWSDIQTALVDTRRVDLISDKRITIRSGNESGTVKDYSFWHPYNHNLVYGDEELGVGMETSALSVADKRGNGDMHIVDIFTPGTGAVIGDILQLQSTSSIYWHEK
uniref:Capsid protein n=1 Tax=Turdus hortulorum Genomoviridae sp. TaxID=2814995 RepID=A0A8E7G2B3_9VIRU|nr:MAG: capsid protein [Gemykibivirus]